MTVSRSEPRMSNPAFRHEHIVYYYCSHLFTVRIASQIQRYRVIIRRQIRIRVAKATSATDEPICRFRCRKNIKTHQDSHGILKRNHSEPFRVIKVEMLNKHRITMRTKRNSPFRTIQNHSSHQAVLVVRRVVVIRETGQQVCVIVCGLVCRNAARLPVAAVVCACSRFGFRVSVAKFPLRT